MAAQIPTMSNRCSLTVVELAEMTAVHYHFERAISSNGQHYLKKGEQLADWEQDKLDAASNTTRALVTLFLYQEHNLGVKNLALSAHELTIRFVPSSVIPWDEIRPTADRLVFQATGTLPTDSPLDRDELLRLEGCVLEEVPYLVHLANPTLAPSNKIGDHALAVDQVVTRPALYHAITAAVSAEHDRLQRQAIASLPRWAQLLLKLTSLWSYAIHR